MSDSNFKKYKIYFNCIMTKEIEKKYLVKTLPLKYEEHKHKDIKQGYICVDGDGTEVMLREKDGTLTLAVKTGKGLEKEEYEASINSKLYNKFWSTTSGRRIKKTRYYIPYQKLIIHFDIYHGHLKGLYTAEIKFSSIEECNNFIAPKWIGDDITNEVRYKNKNLAIYGVNV